jgi:hypothetical protein
MMTVIMKNKCAVAKLRSDLPVIRLMEVTAMVEGEARQRDILKAREQQDRDLAALHRLLRIRSTDPGALSILVARCITLQARTERRIAALEAMLKKLDACLDDLKEKTEKRRCEENFAKFLLERAQVFEGRELRQDEKRLQVMIVGDKPEYEVDEELRGKAGYFVVFVKPVDVKGQITRRLEGSCLFMVE